MSQEIAPAQTTALDALLSDPGKLAAIPVETVERLWAIEQQIRADAARREFSAAFNRVQAQLEPVRKTARNTQTASMYAAAEEVEAMLFPIIVANGFSVSVSTADSQLPDHMRVVMKVRHAGGHEETHHLDAPIDDKGMKGSPTKTRLHGMGSTLTYVRRHLECDVFGVQLVADNDGNRPKSAATITEQQAADLEALMAEVKADADKFKEFFGIEAIGDLPASRYREAVRMLEAKRR